MNRLDKAINIAYNGHKSQKDKSGMPYIGHVMRVSAAGETDDEKIVGVLHDLVEDTMWTFEMLSDEGFSEDIIEALKCLTKCSEDEPYDKFIGRVSRNPLAIRVKLNDLLDNMDITRLDNITLKDAKRLNKYLHAYKKLKKIKDLNPPQELK